MSVLLPVFDAAGTLPACLTSIARQSATDWECIVVDDGSSDGSDRIALERARSDSRFVVRREPHRGLVPALQIALECSRGRFVARMDADDLMHRRRLAEQAALLDAHDSWSGLGCHVRMFPRRGLGDGSRAYERWLNGITDADDVAREAWVECSLAHPTWMLRAESLRREPYREAGWPEDYDLLLRLLRRGEKLGVLPRRRLLWRQGTQRLSRLAAEYGSDRFTRCKAHHLARSFLADSREFALWGHGATGRTLKRELAAEGRRPALIVEVHPRRIGNRIDGVPVVAPQALRDERRLPLVVSVAGAGPRAEIRAALAAMGFVEGRDFVCAA